MVIVFIESRKCEGPLNVSFCLENARDDDNDVGVDVLFLKIQYT